MTSMATIQGLVAVFFDDFSLTWLPPIMSVTEMVFMGYALITTRFYSSRYMLYLLSTIFLTSILLCLPLIVVYDSMRHHVTIAICYTLLVGCLSRPVFQQLKPGLSLLFYHSYHTPVENIYHLINEFKYDPHKALEKLAHLLQVPDQQMQLIRNTAKDDVISNYFAKNQDVLILEELLDKINSIKDPETLNKLHQKMNQNAAAFILPMFNSHQTVSHLLISTHKMNGKLFSAEEVNALKKVFTEAQFYINADLQTKQARALAHSIAHEMRNPLGRLLLHLEQLQIKVNDRCLPHELTMEIDQGKATIERGKQLIDLILREVSHTALTQETMTVSDISRLILQAVNQFGFENEAVKSRIHIDTTESFSVRANDTLFNFVLFNLLRNALYYFESYPDSTITIRTQTSQQKHVVIFRDTGPGIPENVQTQIFDDFYSYHKEGGSGLGLSYCQRVMRSFGGILECHSQYGEYTEFHLIFPVLSFRQTDKEPHPDIVSGDANQTVSATVAACHNEKPENNLPRQHLDQQDKKGITVLVVDDHKMQRMLTILYLQQMGYVVLQAENGQTAIDIFRSRQVDLILMDIQMPVMNGFEATQKIKQLSPHTPVIALTGESGEAEVLYIEQLMDGRLTKPTNKADLQTVLRACFADQEPNAAGPVDHESGEACLDEYLTEV